MSEPVKIYFYTTLGCHLCEHAQELVESILENSVYRLVMTEIADDEQLMEKYGVRIPVLKRGDNAKELGWPFSRETLEAYLRA